MTIAARIKKIREVRGLKQSNVATAMGVTQQAYSCLEQGANNARLETLKRFCTVMKVELAFLVAVDVPVTQETVENFGTKSYNEFLNGYKKLEQKLDIFNDLLKGKSTTLPSHQIGNVNAPIRKAS